MKILYHHRVASKDGQFVHIEELITALEKLGNDIIVVGPQVSDSASFGAESTFVAGLRRVLPKFCSELLEFGYTLVAYVKLRSAVRRHDPDCLYERYNLFCPAGAWIKWKYKLPFLCEVNAPLLEERNSNGGIALYRLARWSESYVWKSADKVLPVTNVLADKVAAAGVDRERIVVVPNGIDPGRFSPVDAAQAKASLNLQGRIVLGFTGFMREWHGLERLLDVVAADRTGQLFGLLVGDGPVRKSLEDYARKLGILDRMMTTGVVARNDLASYISAFDVALQPAVVAYASPLKVFEYMFFGKAIVAPDTANMREILVHRRNAILFDPHRPKAFEQAIESILQDPALAAQLGANARRTIEERNLTWSNNARRVTALAGSLVK